jgi:chromate transport protein ChrA
MVREHPWLVLRSFLVGKPWAQIDFLLTTPEPWNRNSYVTPILLALAATVLALTLGAPLPTTRTALVGVAVMAVVCVCSTLTSFFYPTALIAEVLVTWLILGMLCFVYLPMALLFYVLRRSRPAAAIS